MSWVEPWRKPEGLAGRIANWEMSLGGRKRNRRAIEDLPIAPTDTVLEIGFGPGLALPLLCSRAAHVVGVDHSRLSVKTARRRLAPLLEAGRLELHEASVEGLPVPKASVDVALSIASYHFWPEPSAALREIRRVLRPGGLVATVLRSAETVDDAATVHERAGFTLVEVGREVLRVVARSTHAP